jgi:cytoskeleton protein RodZ
MPEIGSTLREARMRQRLDIAEIEAATKIRAKYLRALENEEWDLLPGPTFVKSFLRTYAEELGLDGRLLIEEFKLGHERLSDVELQPIMPRARGDTRRPRRSGPPRAVLVVLVLAGLLVALYLLQGDDNAPEGRDAVSPGATEPAPVTPPATDEPAATTPEPEPAPRLARLQVVPSGPVNICLKAAGGRTIYNGVVLQAGPTQQTFRSSRFRIVVGNPEVRLRVNGRLRRVAQSPEPVGYEITPERMRRLQPARFPVCTP